MIHLPVAPVDDNIAGELCTQCIGCFREPASGPDQVTDLHACLKRVLTRMAQQAIGPDHPGGLPVGCLLVQLFHQRLDNFAAIANGAKQDQLVARFELDILC